MLNFLLNENNWGLPSKVKTFYHGGMLLGKLQESAVPRGYFSLWKR